MSFEQWFVDKYPEIPLRGALVVLELAAGGATIPFIARYRKEQTGNLDEVQVQKALESKKYWDDLQKRKEFIIGEINAQGKMTPELLTAIKGTVELAVLEDLYLPYKRKRKTKATLAKEAGLGPLAEWIWKAAHGEIPTSETLEGKSAEFINAEKNINSAEDALNGALDITIETLAENKELRQIVRKTVFDTGFVSSSKAEKAKPNSKFENYFEFSEAITSLMQPKNSHRFLAMTRGEKEEEVKLAFGGAAGEAKFDEQLIALFENAAVTVPDFEGAARVKKAARSALKFYVMISIEAEVRSALKAVADAAAIQVFADNIRTVLLSSPFGAHTVLGVDPGIRTGCKLALVNSSGAYVSSGVVSPAHPEDREKVKKLLKELSGKLNLKAVAVGNGTAGRETETYFRGVLADLKLNIPVVMVSESGASIYSASEVAREEFPELDLTIRGAISIARRFQDPLAELVKVDPKSIGVGQYQHDVSQPDLKQSLERVVESCVNSVGVNLNTASQHLLAYVSGIGPTLAKNIVAYRSQAGLFRNRRDILKVPRFGAKAFEQAAGFLRIPGAEHPLDNTGVHPERYEAIEKFAASQGKSVSDLLGPGVAVLRSDNELKSALGEYTFKDVIEELGKPGRDPRDQFQIFEFRGDIHEMGDLQPGFVCPGIVTNVTNFGAFVDIGVHQDGLVHISQLSDDFVKDPNAVVHPGDKVKVRVLEVNLDKKQISLTMKSDSNEGASGRPPVERKERGKPSEKSSRQRPPEENLRNTPFAALSGIAKR